MECKHEKLKCTNNIFYCMECGASWESPEAEDKHSVNAEAPSEKPKRVAKRKVKKGDEAE